MTAGSAKAIYGKLAETCRFPFQSQPWWLDAVCGPEGWEAVLAFDQDGVPIGAMPYGKTGWKGLPMIRMPLFTAYHHIWIRDMGSDRVVRQNHWEHKILEDLVSKIPRKWLVDQQYSPSFTNGLPFFWKGFQVQTRYTYQLETGSGKEILWEGMESTTRNHIRKAKTLVQVQPDDTTEQLYTLEQLLYKKQGIRVPFSLSELKRIDACLSERQMRSIYVATGKESKVHAASYVVWDGTRAFFLLSGAHPEYRSSGALYLVLWRALKDAAQRGAVFDFEGSMIPNIERVFRSFGAVRVPYLRVIRYGNRVLGGVAALME